MFILCSCWVKEILEFLSQFTDASDGLDASAQPTVHPLTFVVNSFKTPDSAAATCEKLLQFLQDIHKIHGKKFEHAVVPVSRMN